MIVFGLVYFVLLGRSRRPTERDRIGFGLFCAAGLIEKAGSVIVFGVVDLVVHLIENAGTSSSHLP